MTKRMIYTAVVAIGFLALSHAETAGAPASGNRSAEWKQNLALAVNNEAKVASAIQAMPEADRAAFAAAVLAVLQGKSQHMADKTEWANNFSATAAALVSGAGGAKPAVLSAVASEIVNACATGESRELAGGNLVQLGVLAKGVMSQLKGADRVAFANAMLLAVNKQKAADAATHKLALSVTALSLLAGAGDVGKEVLADAFAVTDAGTLGALTESFADSFNQKRNELSNDEYMRMAMQFLQVVAARLAGMPDAATRFADAVAVFVCGAANPAQFEQDLLGKLADLLAKVGTTKDGLATALAAAKADAAANAALMPGLTQTMNQVVREKEYLRFIRTFGSGWMDLPFVHGNRPPPPGGYQNQGIH